jgi:hypothetical protein
MRQGKSKINESCISLQGVKQLCCPGYKCRNGPGGCMTCEKNQTTTTVTPSRTTTTPTKPTTTIPKPTTTTTTTKPTTTKTTTTTTFLQHREHLRRLPKSVIKAGRKMHCFYGGNCSWWSWHFLEKLVIGGMVVVVVSLEKRDEGSQSQTINMSGPHGMRYPSG